MPKSTSSYNDPQHHRSSTQSNKPFKGRHGHKSKSAVKAASKGKVEKPNDYKPKSHTPSKVERRNTQKQIQKNKRDEQIQQARFFGGSRGAAKIVAVVQLCEDQDPLEVIDDLNESVGYHDGSYAGFTSVRIDRFKQTLHYLTPIKDAVYVPDILDMCLPADFIILVMSATWEVSEDLLNVLRSVLAQGAPSIIPVVHNLKDIDNLKTRTEVRKSLLTYLQQYIPTVERIYASDDPNEAATVMRILCTGMPTGVRHRDQRSYIVPEGFNYDTTEGQYYFWGTVRGKPLHADRIIHLPPYGDFQIHKITSLPENNHGFSTNEMGTDAEGTSMNASPTITTLDTPTAEQDSLSPLAHVDEEMADDTKSLHSHRSQTQKGVRIDDHYYFEDDAQPVKKKLPKGVNDYEAAWYVSDEDDSSDEDDEEDEVEMEDAYETESEVSVHDEDEPSDAGETATEMHVDLSPEEEAEQHELFKARELDARFPDEVEYPPTTTARSRFARYRALKNFRSSPWDVDEPEDDRAPSEWSRLVRFGNWRGTCKRIENETLGTDGVKPGVRVRVYLRDAPREVLASYSQRVRAAYSLLKHENKYTTLNCTIKLIPQDGEEDTPVIKSKDVLVVQYGFRRYECRPIFSQPLSPSSENNVRKFERYLQPGRTSVASWLGHTVIGRDVPILYFKKMSDGGLQLVATGSSMPPTPPIIVKRAILTGHPYRVHKKVVTMRYMFFNREDVIFYKPVQLVSKQGRRGWIKEPLGTHGYFKATFDGKIDKQDTVGLSLYKRIWPRLGV